MNLQIGPESTCILKHVERRTAFRDATIAHGQNMSGDTIAIKFNGAACRSKGGQQIPIAALSKCKNVGKQR